MLFKKKKNKQVIEIIIDSNYKEKDSPNDFVGIQAAERTGLLSDSQGKLKDNKPENDPLNDSMRTRRVITEMNLLHYFVFLSIISLLIALVYNCISTILLIHKHSLPSYLFSFVGYDIGQILMVSVLMFIVTLMSLQIISTALKFTIPLLKISNLNKQSNYSGRTRTLVMIMSLLVGGLIVFLLLYFINGDNEVDFLVCLLIILTSSFICFTYYLLNVLNKKKYKDTKSYILMTYLCLLFLMSSSFAFYLSVENAAVETSVTVANDDEYGNVYELISIKNSLALLKSNNLNAYKIYGIEDILFHTYN